MTSTKFVDLSFHLQYPEQLRVHCQWERGKGAFMEIAGKWSEGRGPRAGACRFLSVFRGVQVKPVSCYQGVSGIRIGFPVLCRILNVKVSEVYKRSSFEL